MPIGEYENISEDARHLQLCDREALEHVAEMFDEPILVDFDHASEEGERTEAAAWIESLRFDEESGLWGSFRFTDKGAEAISGRRYRFVSPVWDLDKVDAGRRGLEGRTAYAKRFNDFSMLVVSDR